MPPETSFKNWIEKLITNLKTGINKAREYRSFVDRIICETGVFYIWKLDASETEQKDGVTLPTNKFKLQTISPVPVHLKYHNVHHWYENKTPIDYLIDELSRMVVFYEERVFFETLTSDLETMELNSNVFTRETMKKPISYIISQGNRADTLLIHPIQSSNLINENSFLPYWKMPPSLLEGKGKRFIGMMGYLSVYETIVVPENIGILYEKINVKIRKTLLNIGFKNNSLFISENMFAWSVKDGTVIKVGLSS